MSESPVMPNHDRCDGRYCFVGSRSKLLPLYIFAALERLNKLGDRGGTFLEFACIPTPFHDCNVFRRLQVRGFIRSLSGGRSGLDQWVMTKDGRRAYEQHKNNKPVWRLKHYD